MDGGNSQASPKAAAKALIMRLGVKRVAGWCGVSDFAVYQWFSRATDDQPVPLRHVAAIVRGGEQAGERIDPRALWPGMPEHAA